MSEERFTSGNWSISKNVEVKKNVIDPIDIIDQFGADTARWFVMSDSPPDRDISWSTEELRVHGDILIVFGV